MAKNVGIRVIAMLLILWYCVSVIGFDVHTCYKSDRCFIATFVEGFECEDIHPCHSNHCHCCEKARQCASANAGECCGKSACSVSESSCCSNDYQVIDITGSGSAGFQSSEDIQLCLMLPLNTFCENVVSLSVRSDFNRVSWSGSCVCPCDVHPMFGVWRI